MGLEIMRISIDIIAANGKMIKEMEQGKKKLKINLGSMLAPSLMTNTMEEGNWLPSNIYMKENSKMASFTRMGK